MTYDVKTKEGTMQETKSAFAIRFIAVTGILSAAAFVLQLIEFPLPFLIPSFIKFDFSDLPALIGSFSLGPVCGIMIELVKNLFHSLVSQSFGVGELSNFLLGAVFVGVAGIIYRFKHNKKGAIIGSLIGAISMAIVSLPFNYFIVYPVYYNFMPKETIVSAYQAIVPAADSIEKCLLIFNVPFTFMKGLIDCLITFLIYKKLSPILKGTARRRQK
ncbi:MAG: ECF transporter S component [Lachnospiraceae bacterium]|nr:ECF transporter S component [Lachnospiraceae bacterium]